MLKYIRVSLPKKFRAESQVTKLIKLASECKVKKLKKYEDEFMTQKEENEKFEKMLSQHQMKYNEDRRMMQSEILQLQQKVKKFEADEKKYENIIHDYKLILQRQEQQLEILKTVTVSDKLSSQLAPSHPKLFQIHDNKEVKDHDNSNICSLDIATQRIRELEMELAQSKVSQVETECQNQNLQHQLNGLITKTAASLTPNNNTAPTTNSWKMKWDNLTTAVNNVGPSVQQSIPTFQSHISNLAHQLNSFDETK